MRSLTWLLVGVAALHLHGASAFLSPCASFPLTSRPASLAPLSSLFPSKRQARSPRHMVLPEAKALAAELIPSSFVDSFSGEWIGFESEFDVARGRVVPVASYLLPEEYQEWEVEVKGLEHVTSSTVKDNVLYCKSMRLLPSCGCAVDSVPTEKKVEEHQFSAATSSLFPDGSVLLLEPQGQDCRWSLFLTSSSSPHLRLRVSGSSLARIGVLVLRLEEKLQEFNDAASYWETFRDPKALKRMAELGEMMGTRKTEGRWRAKRFISIPREDGRELVSQTDEIIRQEDEQIPSAPHGLSVSFDRHVLQLSLQLTDERRKTIRAVVRDGKLGEVELSEESLC